MQDQAIWTFDWLNGLKGALPRELFTDQHYPKVFAWIGRFNHALKTAKENGPKPTTLKGDVAARRILDARYAEKETVIDQDDPLPLRHGDDVQVWPIDSGFNHRDRGQLIGLTADEIVLRVTTAVKPGQDIHLHFPRTGFRIAAVQGGGSKL